MCTYHKRQATDFLDIGKPLTTQAICKLERLQPSELAELEEGLFRNEVVVGVRKAGKQYLVLVDRYELRARRLADGRVYNHKEHGLIALIRPVWAMPYWVKI